jgi:hypothetical protein
VNGATAAEDEGAGDAVVERLEQEVRDLRAAIVAMTAAGAAALAHNAGPVPGGGERDAARAGEA